MNKNDVLKSLSDEELQELISRAGDRIYVVLNFAGSSVVRDPGTRKPFKTTIKKRAEQVAAEAGGFAVTWNEAFAQMERYYKEHPEPHS